MELTLETFVNYIEKTYYLYFIKEHNDIQIDSLNDQLDQIGGLNNQNVIPADVDDDHHVDFDNDDGDRLLIHLVWEGGGTITSGERWKVEEDGLDGLYEILEGI